MTKQTESMSAQNKNAKTQEEKERDGQNREYKC